ncbi:MAG: replication-associated recombination protein A [Bernardetiaceae bacterium]|nr:replication-associated recombination protein A [Bernardetiaceae bacterium]
MSLFSNPDHIPLAERMRPQNLSDMIGQSHLCGEKGVISRMIAQGKVSSMILWGSPGVGKTTLARLIGNTLERPFFTLSAISSGVKELRELIRQARARSGSLLFIDEIHRFNKGQQDALLAAVEEGVITLIGATTENPSFEVVSALLSRCQVYTLKPLATSDLEQLLVKAVAQDSYLQEKEVVIAETDALLRLSGGDARKMLNLLEMAVYASEPPVKITNILVQEIAQQKSLRYDKKGEQHYDIISAFIKSLRGSDPNAALYWLARMIEAGEEPKFIARRMLILASEDIGNANPTALPLAVSCFQAVNFIGFPEARITLAQTAVYLACSPKSNASYVGINKAQALVRETGDAEVPLHLRNAPTKLMKNQGYGKNYAYAHNYEDNFALQNFMPESLSGTKLYEPGDNPREAEFRKRLQKLWTEFYEY